MFSKIIDEVKSSFLTNSNVYRENQCEDVIEVCYWLKLKNNHNSFNTYRVVVFRFLIWMKYRGIKLKNMTNRDVIDYYQFIQNPPESWCGSRRHFNHPEWRPFRSSLSKSSIKFNMQILRQLCSDLAQTGYIFKSPFPKITYSDTKELSIEKYLTLAEFNCMLNFITSLPKDSSSNRDFKIRIKWIIMLLIYTGARRSEVANAKMSDLIYKNNRLWFKVIGKGNKYGEIPILPELINHLNEYRESFGLPNINNRTALETDIPLVIRLVKNKYQAITAATIWNNIKKLCSMFAFEVNNQAFSDKLLHVSTHWFRHSSATFQVNAGVDIRVVQKNLRHSSIETTMQYQHIQQDNQHDETSSKFKI